MKNLIRILFVIAVLAASAACEASPQPQPTTAAETPTAVNEPGAAPQLTGLTWTWVNTLMNDGTQTTPNKPGAFTITFREDGTVSGTTDCNSFSGAYTAEDGQLAFGEFVQTEMFCEGSQEQQFIGTLREIQSYIFDGNQLVLLVRYDSGSMTFE